MSCDRRVCTPACAPDLHGPSQRDITASYGPRARLRFHSRDKQKARGLELGRCVMARDNMEKKQCPVRSCLPGTTMPLSRRHRAVNCTWQDRQRLSCADRVAACWVIVRSKVRSSPPQHATTCTAQADTPTTPIKSQPSHSIQGAVPIVSALRSRNMPSLPSAATLQIWGAVLPKASSEMSRRVGPDRWADALTWRFALRDTLRLVELMNLHRQDDRAAVIFRRGAAASNAQTTSPTVRETRYLISNPPRLQVQT